MIEKQTRKQVKHVGTDNGLDLCYDEFSILCNRHLTICRDSQ